MKYRNQTLTLFWVLACFVAACSSDIETVPPAKQDGGGGTETRGGDVGGNGDGGSLPSTSSSQVEDGGSGGSGGGDSKKTCLTPVPVPEICPVCDDGNPATNDWCCDPLEDLPCLDKTGPRHCEHSAIANGQPCGSGYVITDGVCCPSL